MKKHLTIIASAILMLSLTACADSEQRYSSDNLSADTTNISESPESQSESASAGASEDNRDEILRNSAAENTYDRIPMIMVNGIIYKDTGNKSTIDASCGNMDGNISSSVDGSLIPTENNQSNFGSGYGYQYGLDGTIELYMNNEWWVFASESYYYEDSVQEKLGIHLGIKDLSPTGVTLIFSQYGGNPTGELQFGEEYIIEKKNGEEWDTVDTIIDKYAWNALAYWIKKDSDAEQKIDWTWLYGELPSGKYRLYKEVTDFRAGGDYDEYPIYAHFEIF